MRGLFDRLGSGARRVDDVASILEHLHALLNARQGMSGTDEAYGLPDYTDLVRQWPDSQRALERAIGETIERYEPRLQSVAVRAAPGESGLQLVFQIQARLHGTSGRVLRLRTELDAAGRFVVRS